MKYIINKKKLFSTVALPVLTMAVLTPQLSLAQTINYTGTQIEYDALENSPFGLPGKTVKPSEINPQSGNTIIISGPTTTGTTSDIYVYGGYVNIEDDTDISVINNSVTVVAGVRVNYDIYGGSGHSYGSVNVAGNSITIGAGATFGVNPTLGTTIYGGEANSDFGVTLTDNSVKIGDAAIINGIIYGASGVGTDLGGITVTGNSVNIGTGVNIGSSLYGGYGYGFSNVHDNQAIVSDNSVTIGDGSNVDESVWGGYGRGQNTFDVIVNRNEVATGASVNINGNVYGGSGYISGEKNIYITTNSVTIGDGSTVARSVYGGQNEGGPADSRAFVTNNNVTIGANVNIGENIYGGYQDLSSYLKITDNIVTIGAGSTVDGDVYGGFGGNVNGGSDVSINDNIVTIDNGVNIVGNIYGGYAENVGTPLTDFASVVAGNTFNINSAGISAGGVYNFENYNWILPKTVANGDTIVTITGSDAVDLTNTRHTIARENDGARLNVGDEFVLISKASGDPDAVPTQVPDRVAQGHFILYDVDVAVNDQEQFVMRITGEDDNQDNPTSKSFVEGRAAALAFVSQGSDLIATAGIDNIRVMTRAKEVEAKHPPLIPFMIMQGASNRYNTGGHVDIDGFNMATGLASGIEMEQGNKVTLGAFFEYGRGSYDSYNNYADYGSVKGNGDVDYTGGGIFGRIDFAGTGLGRVANLTSTQADGLYLEASLRGGRTSMNFDSNDLIDAEGYRGSYDSKSSYIGGHASSGYVFNFDEQQALDVHARYLWTRLGGDTVTVGIDTLEFDKSMSSRMQIGGRYSYAYNDQFKPYLGAAYEHEFAGDIGATAYGMSLDEPSLKGSTGIIDAGFTYMPNAKNPDWSLNLNAQAFFGQRQGGAGQIKLKYQF